MKQGVELLKLKTEVFALFGLILLPNQDFNFITGLIKIHKHHIHDLGSGTG